MVVKGSCVYVVLWRNRTFLWIRTRTGMMDDGL